MCNKINARSYPFCQILSLLFQTSLTSKVDAKQFVIGWLKVALNTTLSPVECYLVKVRIWSSSILDFRLKTLNCGIPKLDDTNLIIRHAQKIILICYNYRCSLCSKSLPCIFDGISELLNALRYGLFRLIVVSWFPGLVRTIETFK